MIVIFFTLFLIFIVFFYLLFREFNHQKEELTSLKGRVNINLFVLSFSLVISISFLYLSELGKAREVILSNQIDEFLEGIPLERNLSRQVLEKRLTQFIDRKDHLRENLLILAERFKIEQEFSLSVLVYDEIFKNKTEGISGYIFSDYAQALFFVQKNTFSDKLHYLLDQALARSPNNPVALTLNGLRFFQEDKKSNAEAEWTKAIKFTTNLSERRVLEEAIKGLNQ